MARAFRKFGFAVLLAVGVGIQAEAREDIIPGSRYTSARIAALGDAGLPIGDDIPGALFYNPANLAKLRKTLIEPINLSLYVNNNLAAGGMSALSIFSLEGYKANLTGSTSWRGAGGAFVPNFGFPGFGFGVLMQSHVSAKGNGDGTLTYRTTDQLIPAAGFGFRLFNNILRFGYSLQWVNQAIGTNTVSESGTVSFASGLAQGSGWSHTAGMGVTIPMKYLPSFNFVARNIVGTTYSGFVAYPFSTDSSGIPATEPMTFDASFSLQPKLGQGVSMNLIFQDRDITNVSGVDLMGHFAFGMEVIVRDRLFLRGGYGSGYISGGLGFKNRGAEISLTYYSEEIGTRYLDTADTRYVLQYRIGSF